MSLLTRLDIQCQQEMFGHLTLFHWLFCWQAEIFQSDIFPDTFSGEPSLSADEWIEGKNAPPKTLSLEAIFKNQGQKVTPSKKPTTIKKKMPVKAVKAEQPVKEV